tara:strand:+ start:142 stop:1374 length:1233 start_codon:yes stop_codon:yes gene_type:complete
MSGIMMNLLGSAGGPSVAAGTVAQTIIGSDRTDNWGRSVAMSEDGSTIAFGNYTEPYGYSYGRVYVYVRSGNTWSSQATITVSSSINARSGNSIALSGDGNTLVIGRYYENNNSGRVYVYTRSGTSWTQRADFAGSNTGSGDEFGSNVAISKDGTTLAVTAPNEDTTASNSGALYVFTGSGSSWSQQSGVLKSNSVNQNDQLGGYYDDFDHQLDISNDGNTIIVGEQNSHQGSNTGNALIFVRSGTSWSRQATLASSDIETSDNFGYHVAISGDGDTVAVGAPRHNSNTGGVYVFTRSGSSWSQQANIEGEGSNNYFGRAVSLNEKGTALLIGAPLYNSYRGRVYLYQGSGSSWSSSWSIDGDAATQGGDLPQFGSQVEISNDGLVAVSTAPGWDQSYPGHNAGSAKIII